MWRNGVSKKISWRSAAGPAAKALWRWQLAWRNRRDEESGAETAGMALSAANENGVARKASA